MKNRKGFVPALLTLGLVLVGSLVTIGISYLTTTNKIASNPKAQGEIPSCVSAFYAEMGEETVSGSGCAAVCTEAGCRKCMFGGQEKYECLNSAIPPENLKTCVKSWTYASIKNCKDASESTEDNKCTQCLVSGVIRYEYDGTGPPASGGTGGSDPADSPGVGCLVTASATACTEGCGKAQIKDQKGNFVSTNNYSCQLGKVSKIKKWCCPSNIGVPSCRNLGDCKSDKKLKIWQYGSDRFFIGNSCPSKIGPIFYTSKEKAMSSPSCGGEEGKVVTKTAKACSDYAKTPKYWIDSDNKYYSSETDSKVYNSADDICFAQCSKIINCAGNSNSYHIKSINGSLFYYSDSLCNSSINSTIDQYCGSPSIPVATNDPNCHEISCGYWASDMGTSFDNPDNPLSIYKTPNLDGTFLDNHCGNNEHSDYIIEDQEIIDYCNNPTSGNGIVAGECTPGYCPNPNESVPYHFIQSGPQTNYYPNDSCNSTEAFKSYDDMINNYCNSYERVMTANFTINLQNGSITDARPNSPIFVRVTGDDRIYVERSININDKSVTLIFSAKKLNNYTGLLCYETSEYDMMQCYGQIGCILPHKQNCIDQTLPYPSDNILNFEIVK